MKKVFYNGWFGHNNVGDEQYRNSFSLLFWDQEKRFGGDLTDDDIDWADEVVIGGGNIINEFFLERVKRVVQRNKPVSFYSVGCAVDGLKKTDFDGIKHIWIRDKLSQERLNAIGVNSVLAPDASWVLEPTPARGKEIWELLFKEQGSDLYEKKIAVILNGHLTTKQPDILAKDFVRWQTFVADLVEIIDGTSASFAFVPFGRSLPWDDRVPNSWVAHRCKWHKKNVMVWDGDWSAQDALDFLSAADVVISMRLHSTIFATIGGTPVIDIVHHDKNRGFLESMGMSHFGVDYWDFSRSETKKKVDLLLSSSLGSRGFQTGKAERQRKILFDHVSSLK